jgi:hypothetical protein
MTKTAFFKSEPIQFQGGVIADVMSATIETSTYSQAETLLRETLQNACDQKNDPSSQIQFIVEARRVSGKEKKVFDDFLEQGRTKTDPLNLSPLAAAKALEILVIADVGTIGLIGPLDASIDESPSNFAGFFFNVGRPTSDSKSGGAFGLGRTVLTNASESSTILVYSRFKGTKGVIQSRFMGMALGHSFNEKGKRFTGRHWFGKEPGKDQGLIAPFESTEADSLASDFGISKYLKNDTGFVALIVGNSLVESPENERLATEQRMECIETIQRAACVYGWPHMLGPSKSRSVKFHFFLDGEELQELDPRKMPGLKEFVFSYEGLYQEKEGINSKDIFFTKSVKKEATGRLAWITTPQTDAEIHYAQVGSIPLNAIALMRQANFVVKYLEVSQSLDQWVTRGVFRTNDDFDSIFRKSEPVAHDEWNPAKLQLKSGQRNPVKQTLENIMDEFRAFKADEKLTLSGSASILLGNSLGRLFDGLMSTGPQPPKPGRGGSVAPKRKTPQVVPIGTPKVIAADISTYESVFKFQLLVPENFNSELNFQVECYAILENGNPDLNPGELEKPEILRIAIDNISLPLDQSISIEAGMDLKIIEVTTRCAQGIGSTCRVKEVRK